MREIKFRAWHKKAKVMVLWDYLKLVFMGQTISISPPLTPIIGKPPLIYDDIRTEKIGPQTLVFENPELIIQQYTGLKDKNGKEIWEGDIVRNTSWDHSNIWEIIWVEETAQFLGNGRMGLFKDSQWELEVIGNICENPELLKEKQLAAT